MFGYAQSGAVVLELAQLLEGRSHVAEFLEERGTGLHHLGFFVGGELDRELDRWRGFCYEALYMGAVLAVIFFTLFFAAALSSCIG